jgi:hypothetical protein
MKQDDRSGFKGLMPHKWTAVASITPAAVAAVAAAAALSPLLTACAAVGAAV